MVVRERGMAETEVMELGVGIPQIKGCCQWVLISAMSITGMYIVYGRSSVSNPSNDLSISSPPLMANSLLPTPRGTAVAVTFYNFWGFKRLRMTHNISEIIELKFKRLHMSHKVTEIIELKFMYECNPRLTKNHLPRLSLVHREVFLNDLSMPLPPLSSQETQMGGAQNALVVGSSAPMAPFINGCLRVYLIYLCCTCFNLCLFPYILAPIDSMTRFAVHRDDESTRRHEG
ncbi:hypothetical protein DVH24_000079 [Malus domestica]|uniref:Uncharacterized protein n=1 Tax=Malus domestica TaxID=3750 RepID=A0A498IYY9_MALDO|nr:hypothetical protein DVH24_000079 [Malus domestica]